MLYQHLRDELRPRGVLVGSARPGIVDTPMQAQLRETLSGPEGVQYREWQEKMPAGRDDTMAAPPPPGALDTPANSARFLRWLLTKTDDDEFCAAEWDSRDSMHHARWVGTS
jgi:NAD(P)-dependent dehydrogenase (short-subunit alcohol dehydrogenase family)